MAMAPISTKLQTVNYTRNNRIFHNCKPRNIGGQGLAAKKATGHHRLQSSQGLSYKSAGVDIDAGNELVKRIKKLNPSIGGFSGMVPFGE